MSSYTNCCPIGFNKNSTNIRYYLYWYTTDGGTTYPYRTCATALDGNAIPLQRTDAIEIVDCGNSTICGSYNMGIGPWLYPHPTQEFEELTVLKNVAFSYLGTQIAAYKVGHGLKVGGEVFTISNQTGTNAVLNGTWTVSSITSSSQFNFFISTTPTAPLSQADLDFRKQMDFCTRKGFKVVHAKKYWNGRYGFLSDYVANPKVSSKFKEYDVTASIVDSVSDESYTYGNDGSLVNHLYGKLSINGNANSKQLLTPGGLTDCYGISAPSSGVGDSHERDPNNPSSDIDRDYWRLGGGPGCLVQTDYQALIDSGFNDYFKNKNIQAMKDACGINSDRSIVKIPWPWNFNTLESQYYEGPIDGFAAWIEQLNVNVDEHTYIINGPVISGAYYSVWNDYKEIKTFTLSDYIVTETSISFKIHVSHVVNSDTQNVPFSEEPQPRPDIFYGTKNTYNYTGSYTGNASLTTQYTAGQCEAEALALLNEWNMTDDTVYPWRTDTNCNVAPMVVIKEINGGIGYGFCDTHADIGLLSLYDGTIYGKPLAKKAYYDKGWFDFYEDEYHYTDDPFNPGSQRVCFTYGNYAPSYLPTMTTHWTDGALDTNSRGGFWQPFSRFKSNYIYNLPPFINHGCAFSANNQEAYWVSKWAELKEPLPSQNYWGVCGVQPNQCSIDSHGGDFNGCPPMRDLYVLDSNCIPTSTVRYPNAYPICGKVAIISIEVNMFGYTRIIHSSAPYLRVGDKIDLLDAAGNRPYFNITVTDVVSDTEFYCGTGGVLPTGVVAVASWGSPDPSWYDLSPKGYFVRTTDHNGVITSQEGNVKSTGSMRGIIAILPPGSPELNSPVWNAHSTVTYTNYPYIQPNEHWYSAINQSMADRFWIPALDAYIYNGDEGSPGCAIKNKNGLPCDPVIAPCDPLLTPLVEARLYAPTGAPLQFATNSVNQWNKMTPGDQWGTTCSNVWNYGESATAFTKQYGVANNYGDSLNTSGISTDTDIGWGTADGYFIP